MPRYSSPSTLLFDFFMKRKKIYIYGATPEATIFINSYREFISGIIDRSYNPGEYFNRIKVINKESIDKNCIVINAVSSANTGEIDNFILSKKAILVGIIQFIQVMSNNDFLKNQTFESSFILWRNFPEFFLDHINDFFKVLSKLDNPGKKVYTDYLDARLTAELSFLSTDYKFYDPKHMYLHDFLPDLSNYTFIDIGAFDGENTESFLEKNPSGRSIIIEANTEQYKIIKNKFRNKKSIEIHNCFLGDSNDDIKFINNGNASRRLEDTDNPESLLLQTCKQRTLDSIIPNMKKNSIYIKMDVEGAELEVLKGMKDTVKNNNIILAISIYHKTSDFIDLWPLIESYAQGKKITIKHLTSGVCETVLFIY